MSDLNYRLEEMFFFFWTRVRKKGNVGNMVQYYVFELVIFFSISFFPPTLMVLND